MSDRDYTEAIPLKSVTASPKQIKLDFEIENLRHHKEDHRQWIHLRSCYAYAFLIIVLLQILAINAFFVFEPLLKIPEGLFKVFSVSVFSEVIALALVITRSLFPEDKHFRAKKVLSVFRKSEPPLTKRDEEDADEENEA